MSLRRGSIGLSDNHHPVGSEGALHIAATDLDRFTKIGLRPDQLSLRIVRLQPRLLRNVLNINQRGSVERPLGRIGNYYRNVLAGKVDGHGTEGQSLFA